MSLESNPVDTAQDEYTLAWREYRSRARLAWLLFLGYMPGVGLIWSLIGATVGWDSTPGGVARTIVALSWMVALGIAGNRAARFRCPRCGRPFFSATLYHNSFARRCVHCGLPKWASAAASHGERR